MGHVCFLCKQRNWIRFKKIKSSRWGYMSKTESAAIVVDRPKGKMHKFLCMEGVFEFPKLITMKTLTHHFRTWLLKIFNYMDQFS